MSKPVQISTKKTSAENVSPESIICARELTVKYGEDLTALNRVSFEVFRGEHLVILGYSGSGKTTLLRAIAGKRVCDSGGIICDKKIASIHQDLKLVSQQSALKNVLHGALGRSSFFKSLAGFSVEEKSRATELLKRVGLTGRVHHKVKHLSGGEKQRVAIARALMQEPEVILADEPVAALDDVNAHSIMRLIRDIAEEQQLTVISVLHDAGLANTYADKILELEDGRLVEQRMPSEELKVSPPKNVASLKIASSDLSKQPSRQAYVLSALGLVALSVLSFASLDIAERQLTDVFTNLWAFVKQLFPSTSAEVAQIPWGTLFASLLETINMAFLGTLLGVFIALPLSALAAKNTGPRFVRPAARFILNVIRTVPSLIWALIFVAAVGLGKVAGIFALVAYSVGYLSKFFYEAFEGVNPGPTAALDEIGASGLQKFFHSVWPAAMPAFLSSSFFMFEYNVRAASILGVVDAGGIGFYIKQYIDFRFFPAVTACLLMILVVVLVLDAVSNRIRAWLVKEE